MDENGWLVLSRKEDQGITVRTPSGERIEIVIARLAPGRVTLAFKAEREVDIKRAELLEAA
jgi:sRNA-binding carbon storage regulator CsrA